MAWNTRGYDRIRYRDEQEDPGVQKNEGEGPGIISHYIARLICFFLCDIGRENAITNGCGHEQLGFSRRLMAFCDRYALCRYLTNSFYDPKLSGAVHPEPLEAKVVLYHQSSWTYRKYHEHIARVFVRQPRIRLRQISF